MSSKTYERGLVLLSNDHVFSQMVALLNSIEANTGNQWPVVIIPYDDNITRIREEIARRPNVILYENKTVIDFWEGYARRCWEKHPKAKKSLRTNAKLGRHAMGVHRRYAAFDKTFPLESFIYIDTDALVLSDLTPVFEALNHASFITYDFQHKDLSHVFNVSSSTVKAWDQVPGFRDHVFCSGFFASRRGVFSEEVLEKQLHELTEAYDVLYPNAPDQSLLNYLCLRGGIDVYNLALRWPKDRSTGNCVTSLHFKEEIRGRLFDHGKPLLYLHYIGLGSEVFRRSAAGETMGFPYESLFKYYLTWQAETRKRA